MLEPRPLLCRCKSNLVFGNNTLLHRQCSLPLNAGSCKPKLYQLPLTIGKYVQDDEHTPSREFHYEKNPKKKPKTPPAKATTKTRESFFLTTVCPHCPPISQVSFSTVHTARECFVHENREQLAPLKAWQARRIEVNHQVRRVNNQANYPGRALNPT